MESIKTEVMSDLDQYQVMIEAALQARLKEWGQAEPSRLYRPVLYSLEGEESG